MFDFLVASIPPPSHIRSMLVLSSAFNGYRNIVSAWDGGLQFLALLNSILTATSVMWWWRAKNKTLLLIDQLAITLVFSNQAILIYRCSSISQVMVWIAPGASLVTTSYLVRHFCDTQHLSYYVWIAFHIFQTQSTVEAIESLPADCPPWILYNV
jgi:hypothetical protein